MEKQQGSGADQAGGKARRREKKPNGHAKHGIAGPFDQTEEALRCNGYSPIALIGKIPPSKDWPRWCKQQPTTSEIAEGKGKGRNVGVATGFNQLIGIDIDDGGVEAKVRTVIAESTVAKKGARGRTDFYRKAAGAACDSRQFRHKDDGHMLVEILGDGRQSVIPPSIHPDTGQPYDWLTEATLLDTCIDDLPECPANIAELLQEALKSELPAEKSERAQRSGPPPKLTDAMKRRHRGWALTALDARVKELAAQTKPGRNSMLYKHVCALGRFVHHGIITDAELRDPLIEACGQNGLKEVNGLRDCHKTIDRGLRISLADHLEDLADRDHQDEKPKPAGLPIVTVASFADKPVPLRGWHVKGLIPQRNTTLLGGDGGTGKSLLAAQLSVATVLGREWLGCEVRRGPVLYLGAEDDLDEMHRRFDAIAREQGVELERLENLHLVCLAGKDAVLAMGNDRGGVIQTTPLWGQIRERVVAIKPKLIVYDTLADLFSGNENIRPQARQFVTMLRGLAIETDSTALLLAHPSVSGMNSGTGTSGSTGWSNSVRSRLYLDRVRDRDDGIEPDPDARVLKTMKNNYGPTGGEIKLQWRDGVFVMADGSEDTSAKVIVAEAVFLELLRLYSSTGRTVSSTRGTTYAPALFAQEDRGRKIGKVALQKAMNRMLEDGRIRVVDHGSPSRPRKHLEVAR